MDEQSLYQRVLHWSGLLSWRFPTLAQAGRIGEQPVGEEKEWVTRLVGLYQEQLDYVAQVVELTEMFFRQGSVLLQ